MAPYIADLKTAVVEVSANGPKRAVVPKDGSFRRHIGHSRGKAELAGFDPEQPVTSARTAKAVSESVRFRGKLVIYSFSWWGASGGGHYHALQRSP